MQQGMWKCHEVHMDVLPLAWKYIRPKNSPDRIILKKKPMVLILKSKRYKGKHSIFNCKTNIVYMYYNTVTKGMITGSRKIIIELKSAKMDYCIIFIPIIVYLY